MSASRTLISMSVCFYALATLAPIGVSQANPPLIPIPAPNYSFDLASPSVMEGTVSADAILQINDHLPLSLTGGVLLGLGASGDDLDALSSGNPQFGAEQPFVLLFSVDRNTVGMVPPFENLVEDGVAYNAQDQAARGQQAGDQFMSLAVFTRSGIEQDNVLNNVLVRNNYDEGGTDFGALPAVSAEDVVVGSPQDHVDAMAYPDSGGVYFSTTAVSPSLAGMSCLDEPSGAHILFCIPAVPAPTLYASCYDLGLEELDDVDALIVFDANADGLFNGTDQVLFSLTQDSPTLSAIPGASESGAGADVFVVTPGEPPALFASAELLGLGAPQDNIDALELLLCDNGPDCAQNHAILSPNFPEADDDEEDEEEEDDEMEFQSLPQVRAISR